MAINEAQKLGRPARYSQESFLPQGSLLNQTRLDRFILIALLLHASVIILQSIFSEKLQDSPTPPPIKVKYVDIQQSDPKNKKAAFIKTPESKKTREQRVKISKSISGIKNKLHTNKKIPKLKKHHQTKPIASQTQIKPNIRQRKETQVEFQKAPLQLMKTTKNNIPIQPSDKRTVVQKTIRQHSLSTSSEKLNSRRVLSMLDGFDAEKYAMQDTRTQIKEHSNDDPISLDTREAKYVSYFNRIKHQIQRVWRYPAQASQRRISGRLTLKFQISRDGNLLDVSLTDNSGFEILDVAAIKAVKEAAPYYPFPLTIPKKKLSILATFVYSPPTNQTP